MLAGKEAELLDGLGGREAMMRSLSMAWSAAVLGP